MPPAPVTANTTVHDTPPVAQDQDTKAAPTTPSAAENSTTSTTFSTSTGPSEAEMREIEARARAYAADKLERLSDLLDRLRVNLVEANANGSTPPPPPPPTPDEPRMV